MPFNMLSSLQSETQSFYIPPTYNTFTQYTNKSANTQAYGCNQNLFGGQTSAISDNGQYLLYTNNASRISKSNDGGTTFSVVQIETTGNYTQSVCMSGSGQYQYAISAITTAGANNFWYSTDYGANWTGKNVPIVSQGHRGLACANVRGECVLILCGVSSSTMKYSINAGATFTNLPDLYRTTSADVSDDGSAIFYAGNASGGTTKIFKSTNVLTDYSTINPSPTFTQLYDVGSQISTTDIVVSSDYKYIILGTELTYMIYSNNSGTSFSNITMSGANARQCLGMSRNGKYMITGSQSVGIKYSTDYGSNWTVMVNTGTTNFLSNPPSSMAIGWYGVCVSKSGDYSFIVTTNTTGTDKLWYGTNTVV